VVGQGAGCPQHPGQCYRCSWPMLSIIFHTNQPSPHHFLRRYEHEIDDIEKTHESELRHEHCALEDKDSVLCSALEDLSPMQSLLSQCQGDLSHPKCALGHGAAVARTWGDTYSHVSSQLEVNTLKRDVDRLEDKLSHWRKDVGDREDKRAPSVTNSVSYGPPDLHNIPYQTGQRTMGPCCVYPR
jgi:hypothetical protein